MSNHLPECGVRKPCGVCGNITYAVCICDRLRACEQRVREDEFSYKGDIDTAYGQGWNEALHAAREAVERVSSLLQPLGPALAAIDALREGDK